MEKIILNRTYITSFGTEFTPVEKVVGALVKNRVVGNPNTVGLKDESRYLDKDGNRIRKSKLKKLKL